MGETHFLKPLNFAGTIAVNMWKNGFMGTRIRSFYVLDDSLLVSELPFSPFQNVTFLKISVFILFLFEPQKEKNCFTDT